MDHNIVVNNSKEHNMMNRCEAIRMDGCRCNKQVSLLFAEYDIHHYVCNLHYYAMMKKINTIRE